MKPDTSSFNRDNQSSTRIRDPTSDLPLKKKTTEKTTQNLKREKHINLFYSNWQTSLITKENPPRTLQKDSIHDWLFFYALQDRLIAVESVDPHGKKFIR